MGAHNLLETTNSAIEKDHHKISDCNSFQFHFMSRESGSQGFSNMTTTGSLEAVVTSSAHRVMTP